MVRFLVTLELERGKGVSGTGSSKKSHNFSHPSVTVWMCAGRPWLSA